MLVWGSFECQILGKQLAMLSKGEDAMPSWHHHDPGIPILGVCPQETLAYMHKGTRLQ